jgi:Sec-independent protein translocase protein TatA
MRKITAGTALLAGSLALGGLGMGEAAAQGLDRSYDRMDGRGYGSSMYDRQQERVGGSDWREQYERGYRLGREDERRRAGAMRGEGAPRDWGGASMGSADDQGVLILLIERDRQQQAMRDVRQALQEARTALQQGDQARARGALDQAEQTLRQANALQNQQQIERSLTQAEQALQRGDRQGIQQALQQARQAMRNSAGGSDMQGQQGGSGGQAPAQPQPAAGTGAQGQAPGATSGGGAQGGNGAGQPGR